MIFKDNLYYCFEIVLFPNQAYYILDKKRTIQEFITATENFMEPVISQLGKLDDLLIATQKVKRDFDNKVVPERGKIVYLIRTNQRKRLARIRNLINKNVTLDHLVESNNGNAKFARNKLSRPSLQACIPLSKTQFEERTLYYEQHPNYSIRAERDDSYKGNDIAILHDRNNWYKWQKKLYDTIFDEYDHIRDAVSREIIFIEDPNGNSGKSTFWKWLYTKHSRDIGLLSEASSSQLKANLVRLGVKKLYIVDLPRTSGDVGTAPLINVLESLKNGLLNTSMYGSAEVLRMDPPWIVLTGNSVPSSSWTPDRWTVYTIRAEGRKDWMDVSEIHRKLAREEIELDKKLKILKYEKKVERAKKFQGQLLSS